MTEAEEIITEQSKLFRAFTDWLQGIDYLAPRFKSEVIGYTGKLTENALKIGVAEGVRRALEHERARESAIGALENETRESLADLGLDETTVEGLIERMKQSGHEAGQERMRQIKAEYEDAARLTAAHEPS